MSRDRNVVDGYSADDYSVNASWIEEVKAMDEADRLARHSY